MNQSYLSEKYILGRSGPAAVPLSGKKYQKFPSGLVRIDQEFVSAKTEAGIGAARERLAVGNIMPGTETLGISAYIFPQPTESYDIPGFCKFSVSAYSKEGGPYGQVLKNSQIVDVSQSFNTPSPTAEDPNREISITISERWLVDSATFYGVTEANAEVGGFGIDLEKKLISRIQTSGVNAQQGAQQLSILWIQSIVSITRRNFGRYDEFEVTQSLIPNY